MSTPPTKRRRIDSAGIHKPFVSPLKRTSSTTAATTNTPTPSQANAPYTPHRSSNLKTSLTPSSTQTLPKTTDPEIQSATKELKALEARARELRNQIATLAQASSLPCSTTSTPREEGKKSRLQVLELKWRRASQDAAEEVFADFSTRIKDYGGIAAFRRDQREAIANDEWRCNRREGEECEGLQKKEEDEEEEEEEVTMASMLHILNIPLETIGWDELKQSWLS